MKQHAAKEDEDIDQVNQNDSNSSSNNNNNNSNANSNSNALLRHHNLRAIHIMDTDEDDGGRKYSVDATTLARHGKIHPGTMVSFFIKQLKKKNLRGHIENELNKTNDGSNITKFNVSVTTGSGVNVWGKREFWGILNSFLKQTHLNESVRIASTSGVSYQLQDNEESQNDVEVVAYHIDLSQAYGHAIANERDDLGSHFVKNLPKEQPTVNNEGWTKIIIQCSNNVKKQHIRDIIHKYLKKKKYLKQIKTVAPRGENQKNKFELHRTV